MLSHNQRVHVHHGTAEVLARCTILDEDLGPGDSGWVQLRLERPLALRARDRFVIRAYSPVATIGGGEVAEPTPPKRNRLEGETRRMLERILDGDAAEAVAARVELSDWQGSEPGELPVQAGATPGAVALAIRVLEAGGALRTPRAVYAASARRSGEDLIMSAVTRAHTEDALRPVVPLSEARAALPPWSPPELADALIAELLADGRLEADAGGVRLPGHRPVLSADQEAALARLTLLLEDEGLGAPSVDELPEELRSRADLWSLVRRLESQGVVRLVADGVYLTSAALDAAAARVRDVLAGRTGLGPADFRDTLPVTRKRLIPLLNHFDGTGVTVRRGDGRDVPAG
jgi:selenocysteine-specific elongation factor